MLRVCSKCLRIHDHKFKCNRKVATRNTTQEQDKLNKFYRSYQWRKVKELKRKDILYQCEVCNFLGGIGFCDEVHHVLKLGTALGWEARLDYDGLLGVCVMHHREIDKLELKSKEEIFNFYSKKKKS